MPGEIVRRMNHIDQNGGMTVWNYGNVGMKSWVSGAGPVPVPAAQEEKAMWSSSQNLVEMMRKWVWSVSQLTPPTSPAVLKRYKNLEEALRMRIRQVTEEVDLQESIPVPRNTEILIPQDGENLVPRDAGVPITETPVPDPDPEIGLENDLIIQPARREDRGVCVCVCVCVFVFELHIFVNHFSRSGSHERGHTHQSSSEATPPQKPKSV